jgi:hypothetical protein
MSLLLALMGTPKVAKYYLNEITQSSSAAIKKVAK